MVDTNPRTMNTTTTQDLFAPVVPRDRLHPSFRDLATAAGYAPSRAMMQRAFSRMGDRDGNFIQQFQTDGFDARTWELYLHATFDALGFAIDLSHDAPDLLLEGRGMRWAVEATTANPTVGGERPVPDDPGERAEYLREELPIKLGSPLLSKLRKRYWERPHIGGLPLVVAIQSFASEDSLHYVENSLLALLFGLHTSGARRADGMLEIVSAPIATHTGSKTIPSRFFGQPDAEHIAAVLWSNSGTVAKFGRLAYQQGLASTGLHMLRFGTRFVMDPNASEAAAFSYEVGARHEGWAEGLVLIHNPQALHPLPYDALPEAVHHELTGGRVVSSMPRFHAFNSITLTRSRIPR